MGDGEDEAVGRRWGGGGDKGGIRGVEVWVTCIQIRSHVPLPCAVSAVHESA